MSLTSDPSGRTPIPARTVVPKGEPKNQTPFTRKTTPVQAAVASTAKALKSTPTTKTQKLSPAEQAVNNALAPLYASQKQDATNQNQAIQNYSLAAMRLLQGTAPQIENDYERQLSQQQGLMGGALAAIQGANPNAQTQSLLQAIGAPQSQQDAVAQQNSNAFNLAGATGSYVDSLPLGSLRAQGLAAETLARLQPSIQGLRGQQALAGALLSQNEAKQKIDAMRPDLLQRYQSAQSSANAKRQQLDLERQALGLRTQNQGFNQAATTARLNQSAARIRNQQNQWLANQRRQINEFNARQTTANNKLGLPNNSLSRTRGYLVDGRGNAILVNGKKQILPGFRTNGQGQVIKIPGSGKKGSGFSATQIQKYRGTAASIAINGKNGFTDSKGKKYPPITPYQAWEEMRKEGIPTGIAISAINRAYGTNYNPKGFLP